MDLVNEKFGLWLIKVPNHIYKFVKDKKPSEEIGSIDLNEMKFEINVKESRQPYILSMKINKNKDPMFLLQDRKDVSSLLERVNHRGQLFDNNANKNEVFSKELQIDKLGDERKPNVTEEKLEDTRKIVFHLHDDHNDIYFPDRNLRFEKLTEQEIKGRLFSLFERNNTLSINFICENIPGQPKKTLEEVVKKYCDVSKNIQKLQVNKGNRQYSLKEEYRSFSGDMPTKKLKK